MTTKAHWRPACGAPERRTRTHRRVTAVLAAAMLAITATLTLSTSAGAVLSRFGPVAGPGDPAENFPTWYADANGIALQMCLDGLPNCLVDATEFVPVHQDGGDAEAFYFHADADVGPITISNALESAYAADGPDQEMVFVRTQIAAQTKGLIPGEKYTVTDPYGTLSSCTATDSGDTSLPLNRRGWIRNNACRTETVPAALDFAGALRGRVGPFLVWDSLIDPALGAPPPAGYIGDNVTPHRVLGSPTGFNKTRVVGKNINAGLTQSCAPDWTGPAADCAETDLFVIQGKLQPGPAGSLSAPAVDFGNIAAAATRSISYRSTGSADVTVSSVTPSGSTDFAVTDNCAGRTLAPGTSCQIDVTYTPVAGTRSTGSITVSDDTAASPRTISLKGESVPAATAAPTSIAFGNQKVNTNSVPETVTVGNSGVAPMTVTGADLSGTGASHFSISGNTCTAAPVAADGGCEVQVTFRPTSSGAKSATLNVRTNGGDRAVSLTGTGTTPVVGLSTASIDFGDQATGTTSAPRSVTLTNSGNAPLTIDGVGINGTAANQFAVGTNTCTVGANIAAGSSCVTQTVFRPTSTGAKSATLFISADGSAQNIALTGTGTGPAITTPGAPTVGAPTAGNASATVRWTAPANDGGSPITGYKVRTFSGTSLVKTTTVGNVTSAVITALTNGTTYTFDVAATNGAGDGPFSARSSAVTPRSDFTAPTVTGRSPAPGSTAVSQSSNVTATFSEPVTVPSTAFTLKNSAGASVPGTTVSYNATTRTATLNPGGATTTVLAADTVYTAALTGAITDAAGNSLAPVTWTFTTGPRPTVTSRTPASGAVGVKRAADVRVTFSENVTGWSATNVTMDRLSSTGAVVGTVTGNVLLQLHHQDRHVQPVRHIAPPSWSRPPATG